MQMSRCIKKLWSHGIEGIDLRSVFNGNVEQLFVIVLAEYTSTSNIRNQVVLWDSIITKRKKVRLKFNELRDAEVDLELMWDIMPLTGRPFYPWTQWNSFLNANGVHWFQKEVT